MVKRITNLAALSGTEPTKISADAEVAVAGCYMDFDGNTLRGSDPGARWTLRDSKTDARMRDLVVG